MKKQTTLLIILDGWGLGKEEPGNAIVNAHTPHWDRLWESSPHSSLNASGGAVGLPENQIGNSEVGHLNIGAGRVLYQSLLFINNAIAAQTNNPNTQCTPLRDNIPLRKALENAKNKGRLHFMGLLSEGGVHSHEQHLFALCRLAVENGIRDFSVHAFLDGRDVAPKCAQQSLQRLRNLLTELGCGTLSSVSGRYYAMDRDMRWERTRLAYDVIIGSDIPSGEADIIKLLEASYAQNITDEFFKPHRLAGPPLQEEDTVISVNFRADRMRQMVHALCSPNFEGWSDHSFVLPMEQLLTMTAYDKNLDLPCIIKSERPKNVLGEVLAQNNKTQLRLAESEKFAHVTYFFNGGVETPFRGEDRHLIPSLKVATYDLAPHMRAREITNFLCTALDRCQYDFILCNYANGDMVGHSGKLKEAISAVETLDECLGQLVASLTKNSAQALITADHGNCEQMLEDDNSPHTAHTLNSVPLIYYGETSISFKDTESGLCALAPGILQLMNLPQPKEMTGESPLIINEHGTT